MSHLFQLGRSGLTVAQAGLNVTGHNIANVNTAGFSRQQSLASTAGAQGTSVGYVGTGVKLDTVRRFHDGFLKDQWHAARTVGASLDSYEREIGRVNQLMADRTVGVAPALAQFFAGVQAVASQPASPEARQELLGRAHSLTSQFQSTQQFLEEQRSSIQAQVGNLVADINGYAQRIQGLNERIVSARASVTGQVPNDLLDQREQLIGELNERVRVSVVEQGDAVNLAIGNGQTLLAGGRVYPIHAQASSVDPTRLVVAYTTADGTRVELADDAIDGGQLGGLLRFRRDTLDAGQNSLGRVAVGLALAFNAQHTQGRDLTGAPGTAFFALGTPTVFAQAGNQDPQVTLTASYTDPAQLALDDYRVSFDGAAYHVTRVPGGSLVTLQPDSDLAAGRLRFDGVQVDVPLAGVAAGDAWLVQPTRAGARNVGVAASDPTQIAAAGSAGGTANGENALALGQLQTRGLLARGTTSINGAYAQLVNRVGVDTQAAQTSRKSQDALTRQSFSAQQAVSGVNLNEEYIRLDMYTQQFSASARVIDVAGKVFDTLLGLRA